MASKAAVVAALNDALRRTLAGGRLVLTAGVRALPPEAWTAIIAAVRGFEAFDPDNDPHGEHDFGALTVSGVSIAWKIDYLDSTLRHHSPDPGDSTVMSRVLTIMLSEEY